MHILAHFSDDPARTSPATSRSALRKYVLVTPARNERTTIEETLKSVIAQTQRPAEWVIVSDGSTDGTDDIISRYARQYSFIRLLQLTHRPTRSFSSVVFATEAGIRAVSTADFEFIGLLDGDLRFDADYFEKLIARFDADPQLGLAGGIAVDVVNNRRIWQRQHLKDVAGAVQFFERSCFESLGGLIAIPEGGWDAITNVQARARGYGTATFPDLVVDHLKPRNTAHGGAIRRKWQHGLRDYALGYDPVFELIKCIMRVRERPLLLGAIAWFAGFTWATFTRRRRSLPRALVVAIRQEQRYRMLPFLRRPDLRPTSPSLP